MPRKRKSGPRGNLYAKLFDGKSLPKANKAWRKLSRIQKSRLIAGRAIFRRKQNPKKYRQIARMVRRIRGSRTQAEFAKLLGLSLSSIKRYEMGSGHLPKLVTLERLKALEGV